MSQSTPPANPAKARLQLLILMLIPIVVVLAATFVFFTGIGLPEGTKNKGALVIPPLQLAALQLKDAEGRPATVTQEKENEWIFMQVMGATCDESCRQRAWEVRQTRIALGKYQDHVHRVWLMLAGPEDQAMSVWRQQEHADVQRVFIDQKEWDNLKSQAGIADESGIRFFLVDPRGFIMMYYDNSKTYKDVIADMKFLLKGVE